MTPAQLEHLKLIDAHLERLLAIAEKRTPGEYVKLGTYVGSKDNHHGIADFCYCGEAEDEDNASYFASCAGNAEAGWKTLRDEVHDYIERYEALPGKRWPYGEKRVVSILAAFPLELIQKP